MWRANSPVMFIYTNDSFIMVGSNIASTSYYGATRLNNSVTSTSTSQAATANALKTTYDAIGTLETSLKEYIDEEISGGAW